MCFGGETNQKGRAKSKVVTIQTLLKVCRGMCGGMYRTSYGSWWWVLLVHDGGLTSITITIETGMLLSMGSKPWLCFRWYKCDCIHFLVALYLLFVCVNRFSPRFLLFFSCNQRQQLELEQLHDDYEHLRSQEHHKSRQLEELTWASAFLSWLAFKQFTIWSPGGELPLLIHRCFPFFLSVCLLFSFCLCPLLFSPSFDEQYAGLSLTLRSWLKLAEG